MKTLHVRITGKTPLLMHSDRGANPLDPDVKKHKELTSKRKKTDEDHEAIALSEWRLALYYDKELGPYMPTMNVRASLIGGAKFNKLGATIKRSTVVTTERIAVEYDGPRDIDKILKAGSFVDTRSVVIGGKRLMRNRPVFHDWAVNFELMFDENQIEGSEIMHAFDNAGLMIGLGDYRPEKGGLFGRYAATVIE